MVRTTARTRDASGMSLVGLLALIVILGVLTAAAVIGVNSLTSGDDTSLVRVSSSTTRGEHGRPSPAGPGGVVGPAASAACEVATGAATSASSAYFAGAAGAYPSQWSDLTSSSAPLYVLPKGVVVNPRKPTELDGLGWKLTMTGGGSTAPTFACSFPRS